MHEVMFYIAKLLTFGGYTLFQTHKENREMRERMREMDWKQKELMKTQRLITMGIFEQHDKGSGYPVFAIQHLV